MVTFLRKSQLNWFWIEGVFILLLLDMSQHCQLKSMSTFVGLQSADAQRWKYESTLLGKYHLERQKSVGNIMVAPPFYHTLFGLLNVTLMVTVGIYSVLRDVKWGKQP